MCRHDRCRLFRHLVTLGSGHEEAIGFRGMQREQCSQQAGLSEQHFTEERQAAETTSLSEVYRELG